MQFAYWLCNDDDGGCDGGGDDGDANLNNSTAQHRSALLQNDTPQALDCVAQENGERERGRIRSNRDIEIVQEYSSPGQDTRKTKNK